MDEITELQQQLAQVLGGDRFRLKQRLRRLREAAQSGKPYDRNLAAVRRDVERSQQLRVQRVAAVPQITYEESLPITQCKEEIAAAIARHRVVVVCGDTGSGKSTQLPKICLELGRGIDGMIGHTQPRRIAARSVAARLAEELSVPLGREVGFKVRFADSTAPQTLIKLMTDGILLAETQGDRFLNGYDTIIVDEAHERSLNIDFLLGLLRRLLTRRTDLKVIVTSATIDAERFAEFFSFDGEEAPIINVPGRMYPVELRYRPIVADNEDTADAATEDQALLDAVDEVAGEGPGDVLVFMPTERHIREIAKQLRGRFLKGDPAGRAIEILPLYGRLSLSEQRKVFQPQGRRRVVIATNVAESSLTVPGIRYVVDTGTARISRYSARSKVQRLPIEAISQASADQRMGRCGRVGPGVCLRLYSEQDYNDRERYTPPEIQRTNLAAVILQTLALGLGRIEDFPFIDPPRPTTVRDGYATLAELGAIDEEENLTDLGRRLARLPVDPRIGRMVLAAADENCLAEVLIIAAALEVQDPRDRPLEKQQAADEAHQRFVHPESDFFTLLNIWDFYHQLREDLSHSRLRKACQQNFLSFNRIREWLDVHRQLLGLLEPLGMKPHHARQNDYNAVHRALLTGLLSNIAMKGDTHEYQGGGGSKLHLWPGSGTFAKKPRWVVAAELVETSRRFLRTVARIDPSWLEPIAGDLVRRQYHDERWDRDAGGALVNEKVTLFGLPIVPSRRIRLAKINPARSRDFLIESGLVDGDINLEAPFLKHNQQILDEVASLAAKTRRQDLLRGAEARLEFYDQRLPADVVDVASLERWRRTAEQKTPRLLYFTKADLMFPEGGNVEQADFPDSIRVQHLHLPLEYHLDPGAPEDGITLRVPREGLNQLDPQRLGWLVPGLLEEKVIALIRSLPKPLRRTLVPAPDMARRVVADLPFAQGDIDQVVAQRLSQLSGQRIHQDDFRTEKLPRHLQMNVCVVDDSGETVAHGRDLHSLRQDVGVVAAPDQITVTDNDLCCEGRTQWDFGDLPESVDLERGGIQLQAYPAIVDEGNSVAVKMFDSAPGAREATAAGLRRLFLIAAKGAIRSQVDWLPGLDRLSLYTGTLGGTKEIRTQLGELMAELALEPRRRTIRTAEEFAQAVAAAREQLPTAAQRVAGILRPLLETRHRVQVLLEELRGEQFATALADIQLQLDWLFPDQFLTATPWSWLQHYPRYLSALVQRLEKLKSGGLVRDRELQREMGTYWRKFLEKAESQRARGIVDPELNHFRWMLEEWRVSLWAQQLKTAISVSDKRLDRQWQKVRA